MRRGRLSAACLFASYLISKWMVVDSLQDSLTVHFQDVVVVIVKEKVEGCQVRQASLVRCKTGQLYLCCME